MKTPRVRSVYKGLGSFKIITPALSKGEENTTKGGREKESKYEARINACDLVRERERGEERSM